MVGERWSDSFKLDEATSRLPHRHQDGKLHHVRADFEQTIRALVDDYNARFERRASQKIIHRKCQSEKTSDSLESIYRVATAISPKVIKSGRAKSAVLDKVKTNLEISRQRSSYRRRERDGEMGWLGGQTSKEDCTPITPSYRFVRRLA